MEITRRPLAWFKRGINARTKQRSIAELRELGKSLRKRQLSPVWATSIGLLLIGYGRLDAAELEGLDELDVVITDEQLSEADILVIQAQENILREDLAESDRARVVARLGELFPKWMAKDIAAALHVDPSTVTRLMSVSKVIPAAREAFEAGAITLSHVYAMSKVSDQHQHDLLALALGGASRDVIEQKRRRARNGNGSATRLSRVGIPMPNGMVSLSGENLGMTEVIELLTDTLKEARKAAEKFDDVKAFQSMMRARARKESANA